MPPSELARGVLEGRADAISRALALVEDTRRERFDEQRALLAELAAETPDAHATVGLTGPPGVGKSTLAGALLRGWIAEGAGVGVVAVDPSSRRSGGALLGDRARLPLEPGDRAFVRSMAARERLGGLAPATRGAVTVLRAGFDWTLIETVGVGQSEIDVASVARSVVLVLQPGSGDTLQFMKAGILEIPDVLVVHKWDLGALAERTRDDLCAMLELLPRDDAWRTPILGISSEAGEGVAALAEALAAHRAFLEQSGEGARRDARAREAWVLELLRERYGVLGIERLGGTERVRKRIADAPGSALDIASMLADETSLEPS